MTREIALHCMKSYSELHSDLCELCPIYGQTGSDHCFEDALQYVIGMLEQEPTTKNDLGVDTDKLIADCEKMSFDFELFGRPTKALLLDAVKNIVKDLPSVTPIRPKGHWIGHREHCENLGVIPSGLGAYEWCSNCDCGIDVREWHRNYYNFCPNCGSDNREDNTDKEQKDDKRRVKRLR